MKASDFIEVMPEPTKWIYRMGCLRLARVHERRDKTVGTFKFRYWHPIVMLALMLMVCETIVRSVFDMIVDIRMDMHDAADGGIQLEITKDKKITV